MCGIAGLLNFNTKIASSSIKRMIDALDHRGPDGEGIWISDDEKVGFGHRRLSIIDLTENGKQPMHYLNNRYTITFNGEIYNYLEIKNELLKKGYFFKTASDTEVLLALYDLKKEKALDDLDGMFAFAIWDEKEQTLFCARDRFGEKPFFFLKNHSEFAFASEIKALFQYAGKKSLNNKFIFNYIIYGLIENPLEPNLTFFQDVYQLEPSHYIKIGPGDNFIKRRYWDIDINQEASLTVEEAKDKFTYLFNESISRRLRSDVTVGSSLSGGIDSSSIVMMIDRMKGKEQLQKTFSARFKNFEKDEGKYMEMVIQKSKVEPHFVYPTVESAFENLNKVMYHQEMPFGSSSILAQYEVMKLAKKNNVTVLLDGQGADEIIAGYSFYWPSYLMQLYRSNTKKFKQVQKEIRDLNKIEPAVIDMEFKIKSYGYKAYRKSGDILRSFKKSDSEYFMGLNPEIVNEYKSHTNPIYKPPHLQKHLYHSTLHYGLRDLLRYADRNSMANSIEVRLPFLSHKLVEFAFTLKDDLKIHKGWTKYILRKSMEEVLPKEITWRKDKIGYEPPQKNWFEHQKFKELFQEATSELKKEKIITKDCEESKWSYLMIHLLKKSL